MWGIVWLNNGDRHAGNIESRFDDTIVVEQPHVLTPAGNPRTIVVRHRQIRLIVPCNEWQATGLTDDPNPAA